MRSPGPDSSPEYRAEYNEYMRLYMLDRRHQHRADGLALLGGVCGGCGSPDVDEFDFHHIDPATKAFNIGTHLHLGWERLVAEIDKCELRCKECHRDEHRSAAPCGTDARYAAGCKCQSCRNAHNAAVKRYKLEHGIVKNPRSNEIAHGTVGGYQKEKRLKIPTCDACRAAGASAARARRNRMRGAPSEA